MIYNAFDTLKSYLIYTLYIFMPSPLDDLLRNQFIEFAQSDLGKKEINRIDQEIQNIYKISFSDAVKDFEKFDSILKNLYGRNGAFALKKKILR